MARAFKADGDRSVISAGAGKGFIMFFPHPLRAPVAVLAVVEGAAAPAALLAVGFD